MFWDYLVASDNVRLCSISIIVVCVLLAGCLLNLFRKQLKISVKEELGPIVVIIIIKGLEAVCFYSYKCINKHALDIVVYFLYWEGA